MFRTIIFSAAFVLAGCATVVPVDPAEQTVHNTPWDNIYFSRQ
jgi:hypothetical protein